MAHIKCRCFEYRCAYGDYAYTGKKCEDAEFGSMCSRFSDAEKRLGITMVSNVCIHSFKSEIEFEGDYKRYRSDCDWLVVGNKKIDMDFIEYLEIDGRVLVDELEE